MEDESKVIKKLERAAIMQGHVCVFLLVKLGQTAM